MALDEQTERQLRRLATTLSARARDIQEQIDALSQPLREQRERVTNQIDSIAMLLTDGRCTGEDMVACGWCGTLLESSSVSDGDSGEAVCIHTEDGDRSPFCRNPNEPWVKGDTVISADQMLAESEPLDIL